MSEKKPKNPVVDEKGSYRIIRGGRWFNHPDALRSSYRNLDIPSYRYYSIGFRLARTVKK